MCVCNVCNLCAVALWSRRAGRDSLARQREALSDELEVKHHMGRQEGEGAKGRERCLLVALVAVAWQTCNKAKGPSEEEEGEGEGRLRIWIRRVARPAMWW